MFQRLASTLIGVMNLLVVILHTVFWCTLLYIAAIVKFLVPIPAFRHRCTQVSIRLAEFWIDCNNLLIRWTHPTIWDIQIPPLERNAAYLVFSNHRSAVDIPAFQRVLNHKIPFQRVFVKQELIFLPFLGQAWWALDFPFMKRYTRQQMEKNPELRGKDMENIRRVCNKYAGQPITILSYLEGTRITPEKMKRAQSPYRHLLPPRAGGIAGVVSVMGPQLKGVLDLTFHYDPNRITMWDFICGRLRRVTVHGRMLQIPSQFFNRDYNQPEFREQFQAWINGIWQEKDELLHRSLGDKL